MKVVIFEAEEWEAEACRALSGAHELTCVNARLTPTEAARHRDVEAISTFINSRLGADVLAEMPNLKLIATRSTGYDHIDQTWCAAHDIAIANVPDYGDVTVAEHSFALMLAAARHLVDAVERTRRGNFAQEDLRGIELRGKTLGVIGTGRIGRRAIEIAQGFGMKVVAFDVMPDERAATDLGFRYLSFGEVLTTADILTLHLPATVETEDLISDAQFEQMKPGALLINTARGNIVSVPALVRALAGGKLRAAGLDVLPHEPLVREEAEVFRGPPLEKENLEALVANHVLLRFPNVIVTPHVAYNTHEAVARIVKTTIANIEAFAAGTPQNLVKPKDS
jgi:D-lactate dehydrogenase